MIQEFKKTVETICNTITVFFFFLSKHVHINAVVQLESLKIGSI